MTWLALSDREKLVNSAKNQIYFLEDFFFLIKNLKIQEDWDLDSKQLRTPADYLAPSDRHKKVWVTWTQEAWVASDKNQMPLIFN